MPKDKSAMYGRIAKACLAAINSQTEKGKLDPNAIAIVYGAIDEAFQEEQLLLATEMSKYQHALEVIAELSTSENSSAAIDIAKQALAKHTH